MQNAVKTFFIKIGIIFMFNMAGFITIGTNRMFLLCVLVLVILHYAASKVLEFANIMSSMSYWNTGAFGLALFSLILAVALLFPVGVLVMYTTGGICSNYWYMPWLLQLALAGFGFISEGEEEDQTDRIF